MNFNLNSTANAKETGKILLPGIHKATFQGVSAGKITTKDGANLNTMVLKLDVKDYGEFTHNFFEPTSAERKELQWGLSASQADHFLISVRQIIEAVNPEFIANVDNGTVTIGGSFANIVKQVSDCTKDYIGVEVDVKIIPQNNGFSGIPSFPARITKNGSLGISTRFIGHDLTFSASELKKIDAFKDAKPTNMVPNNKSGEDMLADMQAAVDSEPDKKDDLPF